MLTPTPIKPSFWSVWNVHIFAIFAITIVCLAAILWLTLNGSDVPEVFTFGAIGGASYFLGTQAQAAQARSNTKKDDGTPQ